MLSLITPTADRPSYLTCLHHSLLAQTCQEWQWLIYDTSLRPHPDLSTSHDRRIVYTYAPSIVSIGEKRNRLVDRATHNLIVHLDDDDYYCSTYLENVHQRLAHADLCTYHSWFAYSNGQIYYWASDIPTETHFLLDPLTEERVREVDFGPLLREKKIPQWQEKAQTGYGFNFAYKKSLWVRAPFPDADISEDIAFFQTAATHGTIDSRADQKGEAVHIMHRNNTASSYPQFRIPKFLVQELLSPFFTYLKDYPSEH